MTSAPSIDPKLLAATIGPIYKGIRGAGKDILNHISNELSLLSGTYIEKFKQRHAFVKVFRAGNSLALETIYCGINILSQTDINMFESVENIENAIKSRSGLHKNSPEAKNGFMAANELPRLLVFGSPGSGKSTYLKRIGWEALKGKSELYTHQSIPVLLELKKCSITDNVESLIEEIAKEFQICSFSDSARFVESALRQGRLLLLLDGLDELPKVNRVKIIAAIEDLLDQYDATRCIVTCRSVLEKEARLKSFTGIIVCDLSDEQIRDFINNWFNGEGIEDSEIRDKLWDILNQSDYQAAKELSRTPLLLAFICTLFKMKRSLPDSRIRLYDKVLDILLEEWEQEQHVERGPVFEKLHTDLEREMLAKLAYNGFSQDCRLFPQNEVSRFIASFLSEELEAPKHVDGKSVLRSIAHAQGILTEPTEGYWSFSHLTLQEYLCAVWIIDNRKLSDLVEKLDRSDRWEEVFLFAIEVCEDPRELLLLMKQHLDKLILEDEKTCEVINWAREQYTKLGCILTSDSMTSAEIFAFYIDLVYYFFIEDEMILDVGIISVLKLYCSLKPSTGIMIASFVFHHSLCWTIRALDFLPDFLVMGNNKDYNYNTNLLKGFDMVAYYCSLFAAMGLIPETSPEVISELWNEFPSQALIDNDRERQIKWWHENGDRWHCRLKEFANNLIGLRTEWNFSESHKELMGKYYHGYLLLIKCLRTSKLSQKVKTEIESNLFLC